jgi:hypothetical protein
MKAPRIRAAFAIALTFALAFPRALAAQSPAPQDDCALIGVQEAGAIIGLAVSGPDEATERQGHCLFTSKQMSKDGSVLYGFIRAAQVPQLEQYYKAMLRTCAGLVPGAPREAFCKTIDRLSNAGDIDAYYAARTGIPSAHPAPQLGANAVASGDGVFVRRDDYVLEAIVIRDQEVDVARSVSLAQLLLQRLEPKLH